MVTLFISVNQSTNTIRNLSFMKGNSQKQNTDITAYE